MPSPGESYKAPLGPPWGSSPPIWDVVGRNNTIGRAFYEYWSERAAILEFVGGQPRAYAEWAAYQATMQQDAHGVGGVR